jgi:hypothetical protein
MRTERDIGAMATIEPRKKTNKFRLLKLDAGFFNGQGLTSSEEYDSYKDFITRLTLKPYEISNTLSLGGGLSFFQGGVIQNTDVVYRMTNGAGGKMFVADSSSGNIGAKAPRKYRGLDAQLSIKHPWGKTELRGEYWWGTQTSFADESFTPSILKSAPYYIREFNGAFFYLLQNIVNEKNLLVIKYDIYDPNVHISGKNIGSASSNTHAGDVRYNTFGVGYIYFHNPHIKVMFWYDVIKNETTSLEDHTSDLRDNIFTCRLQFRF